MPHSGVTTRESCWYLGIDQGSTGTKTALITSTGELVKHWSAPVKISRREGPIVEQDPSELLGTVTHQLNEASEFALSNKTRIAAIGMACQRSGVCAWRSAEEVVHPLISWQDTRTREALTTLDPYAKSVTTKTSLPLSPHYAAGKISLLEKQFPDKSVHIGTLDSFLLYALLDGK